MIDLKPPIVPSFIDVTWQLHPCSAQYFWYILKRSPAKSAASSPPVPARISMITSRESSSSLGSRSILSSCSSSGSCSSIVCRSSLARSVSSASSPAAMSFSSSSRWWRSDSYCSALSSISLRSLYSRLSLRKSFWSPITSGSVIRMVTSRNFARRGASCSARPIIGTRSCRDYSLSPPRSRQPPRPVR